MGELVDINANKPHLSGKAKCLACKHEWVAVAVVGSTLLNCPNCELGTGVWQGVTLKELMLKCNECECIHWGIGKNNLYEQTEIFCLHCGNELDWKDI